MTDTIGNGSIFRSTRNGTPRTRVFPNAVRPAVILITANHDVRGALTSPHLPSHLASRHHRVQIVIRVVSVAQVSPLVHYVIGPLEELRDFGGQVRGGGRWLHVRSCWSERLSHFLLVAAQDKIEAGIEHNRSLFLHGQILHRIQTRVILHGKDSSRRCGEIGRRVEASSSPGGQDGCRSRTTGDAGREAARRWTPGQIQLANRSPERWQRRSLR